MEEIPSEYSSSARTEKTMSSSSRMSDSRVQCDFDESCITSKRLNLDGRIRQSSWDDSDDDLSLGSEKSPESSRLYSNDFKLIRGTVSSEINELKKQFFDTLEKMRDGNDNRELENLRVKIESKLNSDRRQSPARMKRRTKSSSSSSPVLDSKSHSSPQKIEKLNGPEAIFDEISSKILEFNPKFYLNNFFTELRSKRISLIDSIPLIEKAELSDYGNECVHTSSEITSPDSSENNDYFCKTSRKLSQILEVEENKTDLEKSSEEKIDNCELFSKSLKKIEEKYNSPLQTARSRKSENIPESKTVKKEKYKSLSYEEFGNFQKIGKILQGSLSERSAMILNRKISDNVISLSAKDGRTKLDSPNDKRPCNFVCPLSPVESNEDFSKEPNFITEEKEKNSRSCECLKIDLVETFTSENSIPSKSTNTSERNRTNRTKSANSRQSTNPESPKFTINIGKDSERSIKVEDINTPISSGKDSKIKTHSEASSLEDCSPVIYKKCNKVISKTESTLEPKAERTLESPSLESVKSSSRSPKEQNTNYLKSQRNYRTSHRKKEPQKEDNRNTEFETNNLNLTYTVEKTESRSSMESSRSYENPHKKSSRSGSSEKISNIEILNNYEHQSSCKSSRSSKSYKTKILKVVENDQLSDQETSRSNKVFEFGLPLEISERPESGNRSYRSVKTIELDDVTKDSNPSETSLVKNVSHRTSERSLSSRSKNSRSRRSTPRGLKITSRTNSGKSQNSLENRDEENQRIENHEESLLLAAWKELEKVCDTTGNCTSVSSASSITSSRELKMADQQSSYRKSHLEEPRSIKNSRRSPDPKVIDLLDNNSSDTSKKTKSRPISWTSEEHKIPDIHSDSEKLNVVVTNEKNTDIFFIFEEDEEQEKSSPTQKSESRTESDRNSNKRLSVINEISYDDLKTFNENKEKNDWKHSGVYSERISKQPTPQRVNKSSKPSSGSLIENSTVSNELSSKANNPDDKKWNELIQKFYESSNSSCISQSSFPSFSHKKENSFEVIEDPTLEENLENNHLENLQDFNSLSKRSENKYGSLENNVSLKKDFEEREKDMKALNLEFKEPLLLEDLKEKYIRPVQKPQNLFYFILNKEEPFKIGEFGDVTCWNACKSDTIDSEKPKDHGDGTQTQDTLQVFTLPEKGEKEVKPQRNLWTELKKDFRDSKPFLNGKFFYETGDDVNCTRFIRIGLKTSKSDNSMKRKVNEGSDNQTPVICKFLSEFLPPKKENELLEFDQKRKKKLKSISKSTIERHSSLRSLESQKEDLEIQYMNCEVTPRLSRSISNFESLLQKEIVMNGESNDSFNTSGTQLFEGTTSSSKVRNEFSELNIFLTRSEKKEELTNNWLFLKNPEKEKSRKKSKKIKRKSTSSQREPSHEHLLSRKNESKMPQLKLRNSNCFQNFYKRFISVFCLTSHSSAATSK